MIGKKNHRISRLVISFLSIIFVIIFPKEIVFGYRIMGRIQPGTINSITQIENNIFTTEDINQQKILKIETTPEIPVEHLPQTYLALQDFVNAMQSAGNDISVEEIINKGLIFKTIKGKDGNQFELAFVHLDIDSKNKMNKLKGDYPLMTRIEGKWKEATLRNLGEKIIPIGGTVDFGDKNWNSEAYSKIVLNQFNHISPGGAFTEQWWPYGGADYWTDYAIKNNISFDLRAFWSGTSDTYPQDLKKADEKTVMNYIQIRTRKLLSYVEKIHKKNIPIQIEFANEPTLYYQNQMFWMGMFPNDTLLVIFI